VSSWIFGYGSLIWRPDIPYLQRRPARVYGWQRRFWQGSHDHRGMPDQPGRVVTLVPDQQAWCDGVAYLVEAEIIGNVFDALDHREKNGYQRYDVTLHLGADRAAEQTTETRSLEPGLVYIAPQHNFAYLGPAPLAEMAAQIYHSQGPSGRNIDYLLELATALRELDADDPHVFELETAVRKLAVADSALEQNS
jgi:cation transport protein ChaC